MFMLMVTNVDVVYVVACVDVIGVVDDDVVNVGFYVYVACCCFIENFCFVVNSLLDFIL